MEQVKIATAITSCKQSGKEKTTMIPRINVRIKRKRDTAVDELCFAEDNAIKKSKKENSYGGKSINKRRFIERNVYAANEEIKNYLKTRASREPTAIDITTENSPIYNSHNIKARKFELSRIIVEGLSPYYNENYFVTRDLFKFMVKTMVQKILDSKIYQGKYLISIVYFQCVY